MVCSSSSSRAGFRPVLLMRSIVSVGLLAGGLTHLCLAQQQDIVDTFFFSVDLLEGTSGYYRVQGYNGVQPALTMVRGETYEFDQLDASNWFHPLGFAYFPDGAHVGVDELEVGVGNGDAPVYMIDGYSYDLDTYEPLFFYPEEVWVQNEFTVELTVTDPTVTEIFYFCHIHAGMSGRIYIVDAEGDSVAPPQIELYAPLVKSPFDVECGTFLTGDYAPISGTFESVLCPNQQFVCGDPTDSFDSCMHAIDCKMNYEMRIERATSASNTVVFMHQMIPHHENAVNMARILLQNPGGELEEEVSSLLRDIINTQNAQITFMRTFLGDTTADLC